MNRCLLKLLNVYITVFENISGNKILPKVHIKKDNRTVSVNVIGVSLLLIWNMYL